MREIVLPATREDVWEALTDEERLSEWFANDVELDPRPGGSGCFRWDNGEERRAAVEAVEPEERLVLRWEDDGLVELRLEDVAGGHARARPRDVAGVEHGARTAGAGGVRDRVDPVFTALADPSRRFVLETLAARGTATPTELADELPVTRQAVAKHLAALRAAGLVRSHRSGPRDPLRARPGSAAETPPAGSRSVGAQWDARLDALSRHLGDEAREPHG